MCLLSTCLSFLCRSVSWLSLCVCVSVCCLHVCLFSVCLTITVRVCCVDVCLIFLSVSDRHNKPLALVQLAWCFFCNSCRISQFEFLRSSGAPSLAGAPCTSPLTKKEKSCWTEYIHYFKILKTNLNHGFTGGEICKKNNNKLTNKLTNWLKIWKAKITRVTCH